MCSFDLFNASHAFESKNVFLGYDLVFNISDVLGELVKDDPTVTVQAGLFQNGTLVSALQAVTDLTNGNDFAQGVVCVAIDNAILDPLSRSRYNLFVEVTDTTNTLQNAFLTNKVVNLLAV